MRPDDTAARGTRMIISTAVSTENITWSMYWRKAVSAPTCIEPSFTRIAPNHMMATVVRFMTSVSTGMVTANSRLTRRPASNTSWFATANRASSWPVRTNARMTRTPASVSRRTWLMRSMRRCIAWK